MRISGLCTLVVLVLVCSLAAFADSVNDPRVIIHGTSGTGSPTRLCPDNGCTRVGMNFSFTVPDNPKATGNLFFTNASGKNWTSLTLIERGVPAAAISCRQNLFVSCTTKTLENGSVAIVLSSANGSKNPKIGIPAGSSFVIRFQCVSNGCWIPDQSISAHAGTSVPEPGTVALLFTGLAATFSRRRIWNKRPTA